jgi:hypothetical protein
LIVCHQVGKVSLFFSSSYDDFMPHALN